MKYNSWYVSYHTSVIITQTRMCYILYVISHLRYHHTDTYVLYLICHITPQLSSHRHICACNIYPILGNITRTHVCYILYVTSHLRRHHADTYVDIIYNTCIDEYVTHTTYGHRECGIFVCVCVRVSIYVWVYVPDVLRASVCVCVCVGV